MLFVPVPAAGPRSHPATPPVRMPHRCWPTRRSPLPNRPTPRGPVPRTRRGQESEGFDRTTIDPPADQIALAVRVLAAANPRTVVVLCHGGALHVSVIDAPAVPMPRSSRQAIGTGLADVLFGDINPSGRLAETLPRRIEDTRRACTSPANTAVVYGEGLFIGYRWYDARALDVTYPFGHGLSYTTFDYDNLAVRIRDRRESGSRCGSPTPVPATA